MNKFVVLKNHFEGLDTIIYGSWVLVDDSFFRVIDEESVDYYRATTGIDDKSWAEILQAQQTRVGDANKSDRLGLFAIEYLTNFRHTQFMRKVVLRSNNPYLAYRYCRSFGADDKMKRIIIKNQSRWALDYCKNVCDDPDVRAVIIEKQDPKLAYYYCQEIRNDEDMRQIIYDQEDAYMAMCYCRTVSNDDDMRQIILESQDPNIALEYAQSVKVEQDMVDIIAKDKSLYNKVKDSLLIELELLQHLGTLAVAT